MAIRALLALVSSALSVLALFTPNAASARSVRIGPDYPPGSPPGWTCLALTPSANAVLVFSAAVDPAPACEALQNVINQPLHKSTGGWGMQSALEVESSARQQYANDPGCPPGCLLVRSGARKFTLACDVTVGAIEYVVFSGDQQDPLCGFLQTVAQPQTEQGVTISNGTTGQQTNLSPGTFVQIGDAPAIYVVHDGQLHAFSTWQQFLNAGGEPDLSNVVHYSTLRDNGGLFGDPVQ